MITRRQPSKFDPKLVFLHPQHAGLFHAQRLFSMRRRDPEFQQHTDGGGHGSRQLTTQMRDVQDSALSKQSLIPIGGRPPDSKPRMTSQAFVRFHMLSVHYA